MSQVIFSRASLQQQVFASSSSSLQPSPLVRLPADIIKRTIMPYLSDFTQHCDDVMKRISEVACLDRTCKSIYILGLVFFTENLIDPLCTNDTLVNRIKKYDHFKRLHIDQGACRFFFDPSIYNLSKSGAFSKLQSLKLWYTRVKDRDLSLLEHIPNLTSLDIRSFFIEGSGFKHLEKNSNLQELRFINVLNNLFDDEGRNFTLAPYLDTKLEFWKHLSKIHTLGLALSAFYKPMDFLKDFSCRKLVILVADNQESERINLLESSLIEEIEFHSCNQTIDLDSRLIYQLPSSLKSLKIEDFYSTETFFSELFKGAFCNIRILDLRKLVKMENSELFHILMLGKNLEELHLPYDHQPENGSLVGFKFSGNNLKEFSKAIREMKSEDSYVLSDVLQSGFCDPKSVSAEVDRLILKHMDGGTLDKQRYSAPIRSDAEIKAHKRPADEASPEGSEEPPVKKFKPLIADSTTLKSTEE